MANYQYEKYVLETFIKNQGQLFDEKVAESLEEADEFLDMMMATVVDNEKQLKSYFRLSESELAALRSKYASGN